MPQVSHDHDGRNAASVGTPRSCLRCPPPGPGLLSRPTAAYLPCCLVTRSAGTRAQGRSRPTLGSRCLFVDEVDQVLAARPDSPWGTVGNYNYSRPSPPSTRPPWPSLPRGCQAALRDYAAPAKTAPLPGCCYPHPIAFVILRVGVITAAGHQWWQTRRIRTARTDPASGQRPVPGARAQFSRGRPQLAT